VPMMLAHDVRGLNDEPARDSRMPTLEATAS